MNKHGQEISGYIDIADRLKNEEDFSRYFSGKTKLIPKRSDLSYYNWNTLASYGNISENYTPIAGNDGLNFGENFE